MRFVLFFEAAQIGSGPRCAGVRTGPPRQSPQWPCAGFAHLSIYLCKEKGRGRKVVKAPRCDCTFANAPNAFSFFKSHFQNICVASEIRHFTNQKDVIPSRYASISSKKRNPFFNSDLRNMRLAREIPHFPRRKMCKSFELRSNSTNRFLIA